MKKKILSMLLVATMVMGIFTGCGARGSANEITVSEMFNHILEEEGVVTIYEGTKRSITENRDNVSLYQFYDDGYVMKHNNERTLSSYFSDEGEQKSEGKFEGFTITKDENGQTIAEMINTSENGVVPFGKFERMEIEGESYMVFTTYFYERIGGENGYYKLESARCSIIKDTEYTKDKTIVLDTETTDNLKEVSMDKLVAEWYYATYDANWLDDKED